MKDQSHTNSDQNRGEMSFLEHLEILRWHLVRSSIVVGVLAIVAFFYKEIVFDQIILAPKFNDFITYRKFCEFSKAFLGNEDLCLDVEGFELINTDISGQFTMHMTISAIVGLIAAFPYVLFEFWLFVKPALHPSERKKARWLVAVGSFLFMLGVLFGYYLIAPLSVQFLGNYTVSDIVSNKITLSSFINTISTTTISTALVFQLPLIVFFLSRAGIITPEFMRTYRKHAIVITLVVAAIITPPDIFSQLLVTFPILILYEISIFISKIVQRRT